MMHLHKMFLENQPVIKVLETKNSKGPHVRTYHEISLVNSGYKVPTVYPNEIVPS